MSIKHKGKKGDMVGVAEARKIAIVGLPNTGKSQVFNNLTGEYTLVANYPLTTVEIRKARCQINGQAYDIMDTPGLHCLYIHSQEELLVRDMIFKDSPDIIIQCIDANRLRQSLNLTADLLQLGIPMVISLNAVDETARRGVWIDSAGLCRSLGVPVIESIAVDGLGTRDLRNAIIRARRGKYDLCYGEIIDDGLSAIEALLPEDAAFTHKVAILLLLDDPFIADYLGAKYGPEKVLQLTGEANRVRQQFKGHFGRVMNNRRSRWANQIIENTTKKQKIAAPQLSELVGRLCRHPLFGVPILLCMVFVMYQLVVNVANVITGWLNQHLWLPAESRIDDLVTTQWLSDLLVGDYGVLSLGVANAFLTILPILTVFFLAFSTLEDVGYIPNLCVLTKSIFNKFGLSGNAIMPITLGFGCKTMATITTKSLRSKKEKYIAIYLIAFTLPCAAQMALNLSILGKVGITGFILVLCILGFTWILTGLLLNKILRDDSKSFFVQELPAMRLPNPKAVIVKTCYRLWWFIKEATPAFVYAALILFLMDKIGILGAIKTALRPAVSGILGLPVQMVDVLILCMARREAAAGMILKIIEAGQLSYIQCIVAVVITTMFIPCFANIMAMVREIGAGRALVMLVAIACTAVMVAGVLNWAMLLATD